MKTLFITRHYLDQMLGGPNCSKAFVRAVAEIYPTTTLIYPEHSDLQTQMPFLDGCHTLRLEPVVDRRTKWRKCWDMYRGQLHRFGPFVKDYLSNNSFDIIFIDHSFTASSGVLEAALANGAKVVVIHHNVESQYIKDNQPSWLYRIPYNYFALRAEHNSILHGDLNLTLTDDDRSMFCAAFPGRKSTFHTIGVFEYEDEKTELISSSKDLSFVISGSMSAKQTETATLHFLKEYMPVFMDVCPEASLTITGRNPSERIIREASAFKNIRIVPNPSDLTAEVAKGNYYICPLHTGGGLKLRCMDALRVGLPVLAHRVSSRGYESIIDDGYMFEYSNKDEFAEGLKEILKLGDCHANVADSFRTHFSFAAGSERLRRLLDNCL